ncbi:MAG: type IX secretion system membrane protein PorP/SprF [Bacteroidetes bacterium]|nr:type IX secretion system membrane protein PorP/SprF [Bacteroidota bacterium]
MRDAIAIHAGVTILENYQISYSYDIQIGGLKRYNSGTHEIMLSVSHNIFKIKRGRDNSKFLNQKYGYLF